MSGRTVADTTVLINFLRVDRMDLVGTHPDSFIVTEQVMGELADFGQQRAYATALSAGHLTEMWIADQAEIETQTIDQLMHTTSLGVGERSAIAVALHRGYRLATDDRRAINHAMREAEREGTLISIVRTQDIVVELIECGALSLEEADAMRDEWARNHRFALKIASFRELMP